MARFRLHPTEGLPPELSNEVYDMLDYGDALRCQRVSRSCVQFPHGYSTHEKQAFVNQEQRRPKYNKLHLALVNKPRGQDNDVRYNLVVETNGFACYHCCRVLPVGSSSTRQTRKRNSKRSDADFLTPTGCGRFCISCGVKAGHYIRKGTRVRVTVHESHEADEHDEVRLDPHDPARVKVSKILCVTCAEFREIRGYNSSATLSCDGCNATIDLGPRGKSIFKCNYGFMCSNGDAICDHCRVGCRDVMDVMWEVFGQRSFRPVRFALAAMRCPVCPQPEEHFRLLCGCTYEDYTRWWLIGHELEVMEARRWIDYPKIQSVMEARRVSQAEESDIMEKDGIEETMWLAL
ncbi:hypothetical protein LTR17_020949 [Elasticomyces elasticus]|nr:hypothetical protein LTR17_020949 [Elasticomyces elasticus]